MKKWHLYNDYKNWVNVGGRIDYIRLFGVVGIFVLLIACINFMNLSTARSQKRGIILSRFLPWSAYVP
jgi:hypothetical protein